MIIGIEDTSIAKESLFYTATVRQWSHYRMAHAKYLNEASFFISLEETSLREGVMHKAIIKIATRSSRQIKIIVPTQSCRQSKSKETAIKHSPQSVSTFPRSPENEGDFSSQLIVILIYHLPRNKIPFRERSNILLQTIEEE